MIKIIHDRKKCIGCGMCAAVCPRYFEIDEKDNKASLKNSKMNSNDSAELTIEDAESEEMLHDAEMSCPVKAIKIEKIDKSS